MSVHRAAPGRGPCGLHKALSWVLQAEPLGSGGPGPSVQRCQKHVGSPREHSESGAAFTPGLEMLRGQCPGSPAGPPSEHGLGSRGRSGPRSPGLLPQEQVQGSWAGVSSQGLVFLGNINTA